MYKLLTDDTSSVTPTGTHSHYVSLLLSVTLYRSGLPDTLVCQTGRELPDDPNSVRRLPTRESTVVLLTETKVGSPSVRFNDL